VSFRPSSAGREKVLVKVGVSFVSAAGATANLHTEDPGWNFVETSRAATAEWNGVLGRIAVSGGPRTDGRIFYTALYHSLLFPSVFSDDDGRYMGFDHKVHTCPRARCSTRTFPSATSTGPRFPSWPPCCPGPRRRWSNRSSATRPRPRAAYLPKWVIADNDASEWDGDSVDPIIADAYAYGARQFDVKSALAADDPRRHGARERLDRRAREPDGVRGAGLGAPAHLRPHLVSLHRRRVRDTRVLPRRLRHLAPCARTG
jgi:hypothetical protein